MLQSGVRSSILTGLPTHLVQELNVGTVELHPDFIGLVYFKSILNNVSIQSNSKTPI